jgi:uncharacterized tellurite resistance protein B-like protein
MPVLIAILSVLAGLALWRFRPEAIDEAAREMIGAAQAAKSAMRRRRVVRPAPNPSLAAVDDPGLAAAAMLVALAGMNGRLDHAAEEAIRAELANVLRDEPCELTYILGRRLAGQGSDPNDISLRFSKLWTRTLTPEERLDLYRMAARIVALDGEPGDFQRQTLARLKDRLGLFRV